MPAQAVSEETSYRIYPPNAPGMPAVGLDFITESQARGDKISKKSGEGKRTKLIIGPSLEDLIRSALYDRGELNINVTVKGTKKRNLPIISGHRWTDDASVPTTGPEPCDVMIIGKQLGELELKFSRCMISQAGSLLQETLLKLGVTNAEMSSYYVTSVLKTINPENGDTWRASWVNNFIHLLHQELRLVRPKYILCLGADPVKALLGKNMNLSKMEGQIVEYKIDLRRSYTEDEAANSHTALVMACTHPTAVLRTPELSDKFELAISRFVQLTKDIRWDKAEEDIDHRLIYTEDELEKTVDEALACGEGNIIALDCEWQGDHPQNEGAYLRTIQFSWAHKKAAAVILRHAGGELAFKHYKRIKKDGKVLKTKELTTNNADKTVIRLLRKLLEKNRACGHFLNADLEWLIPFGLDIRDRFAAADTPEESKTSGGLDTALMAHAVDETGDFTLTGQALRYTTAPRYDLEVGRWKEQYCKQHGIKLKDLEGYGDCPDEILYPYALYDADVTRRIALRHIENLDSDQFGNNCWKPFWLSQRAVLAVLEIKLVGIPIDNDRVDELTSLYMSAKDEIYTKISQWANWPELNLQSPNHVRELIYGEQYNGKITQDGSLVRLRPENANSMQLVPLLTTEKRPRRWEDLTPEERVEQTPSTARQALGMMYFADTLKARENGKIVDKNFKDQISLIRNYRYVGQILKSVLRPPAVDSENKIITDANGNWTYGAGLSGVACGDGRVRTTIYQTKETGRWSSARPPLQNLCFDPDTEVLTPDGWKKISKLDAEDSVAQYDSNSKAITFVVPSSRQVFEHNGPMVRLYGEQVDKLVTPNHRCMLRRRKSGVQFEVSAEDFPVGTDNRVVHAGFYSSGKQTLSWADIAFIVAVQADGSYVNGFDDGQGIVFSFQKRRKLLRLKSILDALGANYSENINAAGATTIYIGVKENRALIHETKARLGPDKKFGPWLLDWSQDCLRLFADELPYWDGLFKRLSEYSSSVESNADWAQIVHCLTGNRARKRLYVPSNKKAKLHYCVNTAEPHRRRDFTEVTTVTKEIVNYTGQVYCVTVPTSFIVTRRNGKIVISGNSKKREPDYKKILGAKYRWPLRSVLCAPPGYVMVEADYIGAELFGMAIMSGDKNMIEHATRNQLHEDDPNFYDIHSNIAKLAFNLQCEPTKAGLAAIGMKNIRIVAKAVIFGIAYGRQSKAIALAAKEEGITVTEQQAQTIINTIFEMYPGLTDFFRECRERAVNQRGSDDAPRWLCGPFGRYRRFKDTTDRKLKGDIERQSQNFPIQGMIADAVSIAIANLYDYRGNAYKNGWTVDDLDYKICLQVHDAIMCFVRYDHVPYFIDTVLPACMVTGVPIYPAFLDGTPDGTGPYYLGIDTEVCTHWGVVPLPDQLADMGIDYKYAKWSQAKVKVNGEVVKGLINPEAYPLRVWHENQLKNVDKKN